MTATTAHDLEALRRYARTRDPRAFESLVLAYQGMVLATCRRVLGSTTDAMDAAQETFFKLARHAGEVSSCPGAWLHRAALRTSIDMLRARSSRGRGEARAAVPEGEQGGPVDRTWEEIRPAFDRALDGLEAGDREVIVVRFLLQRSQVEMAREARVSPGTMSRRIDRALGRLREGLAREGVTVAGVAALAAGLTAAERAEAAGVGGAGAGTGSAAPEFMKVGLAGLATPASAGGGKLVAAVGVCALAAAVAVGIAAVGPWAGTAAPVAATVGAASGGAFAWPTRTVGPLALTTDLFDGEPTFTVTVEGDVLTFHTRPDDRGKKELTSFEIVGVEGTERDMVLEARVRSAVRHPPPGDGHGPTVSGPTPGEPVWFALELDGDRLILGIRGAKEGPKPKASQALSGHRVAAGAGAGKVPALQGRWAVVEPRSLTVTKDELIVNAPWGVASKFRVLEWTADGDTARVQAICNGGQEDVAMIGKRVKMLVKRSGKGFVVAMHRGGSPRLNEWPSGFEGKIGSGLVVAGFGEEGR